MEYPGSLMNSTVNAAAALSKRWYTDNQRVAIYSFIRNDTTAKRMGRPALSNASALMVTANTPKKSKLYRNFPSSPSQNSCNARCHFFGRRIKRSKGKSQIHTVNNNGLFNDPGNSILYLRNSLNVMSLTGGNTAILHNRYIRMTNKGMAKSHTIIITCDLWSPTHGLEEK